MALNARKSGERGDGAILIALAILAVILRSSRKFCPRAFSARRLCVRMTSRKGGRDNTEGDTGLSTFFNKGLRPQIHVIAALGAVDPVHTDFLQNIIAAWHIFGA